MNFFIENSDVHAYHISFYFCKSCQIHSFLHSIAAIPKSLKYCSVQKAVDLTTFADFLSFKMAPNQSVNKKEKQTNLRGIGIRRDVLRRHNFVVEVVAKYF